MAGVDRAKQNRMQYFICRKAKMWWKYLFWFCFDLAMVNAFICMKESTSHQLKTWVGRTGQGRQMKFCICLAQQFIDSFWAIKKIKVESNIDNCGNSHWQKKLGGKGRCRVCVKDGRRWEVVLGSQQRKVHLCVEYNCFMRYHQKQMCDYI